MKKLTLYLVTSSNIADLLLKKYKIQHGEISNKKNWKLEDKIVSEKKIQHSTCPEEECVH